MDHLVETLAVAREAPKELQEQCGPSLGLRYGFCYCDCIRWYLINVLSRQIGRIIGRGGETIKGLQQRHNVRISVVKETSTVEITGTPEAADACHYENQGFLFGLAQ